MCTSRPHPHALKSQPSQVIDRRPDRSVHTTLTQTLADASVSQLPDIIAAGCYDMTQLCWISPGQGHEMLDQLLAEGIA